MLRASVGVLLVMAIGCSWGGNDMGDQGNDMSPTWPPPSGGRAHTLFLNFGGATITPASSSDSRQDRSEIVSGVSNVPAFNPASYGGDLQAAVGDIAAQVQNHFAAYDLQVVTDRPPDDVQYVMVMIGGVASDIGAPASARGYAPLDCSDSNGHDIVFVFSEALGYDFAGADIEARKALASVVAQETAHSYGLVHTDNAIDLMYPYVEYPPQNQYFAQGNIIGIKCGNSGFQDSAQKLMKLLGPRK